MIRILQGCHGNIPFRFTLIFLIIVTLVHLQKVAFAQFSISVEIRPRTEFRHGYHTLADPSSQTAIFTSQRSRLNFLFNQERFQIGLSLQDVRVWGDEEQLQNIASVSAHEAWGQIYFNQYLSLKFGRQELVYDDHRLLGNVGWVQQARSHDAVLLKFRKSDWQADLAVAYNNEDAELFRSRYSLNNYRSLFFLWINKSFSDILKMSVTGIVDGFQAADTSIDDIVYRHTIGTHLWFKTQNLKLNGTFYYQGGEDKDHTSISAYMIALKGIYLYKPLSISAGIDFLSGTDALDTGNSEDNTFNTLYATNHKFYGHMDYFLNIPLHTANGGLTDLFAGIKYQMTKKVALLVDYHNFRLANNVADTANPKKAIDKVLGSEIDAVLSYSILPELNIKGGYSVMFPTASMEVLKGGDKNVFQYWLWLMITLKPELLKIDLPDKGSPREVRLKL